MTFRPYSASQEMNYESCLCDSRNKPPGWLLDKLAEEKLKGGYNTRKDNLCTGCYQYKSVNGSCGCP